MEIIYSGGTNKYITPDEEAYYQTGYGNGVLARHSEQLNELAESGNIVAIVTTAKPDNYYDELIQQSNLARENVLVLGEDSAPNWHEYSAIVLMGGTTLKLLEWLREKEFSLDKLESCELLIGDSAGAYVLGAKVMDRDDPEGTNLTLSDGFIQESGLLAVAHINNPRYYSQKLGNALMQLAGQMGHRILELKENEEYSIHI